MTAPGPGPSAGPDASPHCVRHPDRPTGLACTRCGRPACPDCLRPAPVGAHCVDCIAEGERTTRTARTVGGGPVRPSARPVVTTTLVVVNVAVFVLTALSAGSAWDNVASPLVAAAWLVPADVAAGEWWRLVTAGFLHAGPLHIAFNMIALWILGRDLELVLGRLRYGLLYGVSLLGSSTAVTLLGEPFRPVLGASGAVFGLMGALVIVLRRLRLSPGPALLMVGINVVLTFTIPGLSVLGHLGGLATGLAVAAVLVHGPARSRPAAGLLAVGGIAVVLVVLVAVRALTLGG
ncbi:rhomboid family intramembrane serine protease [Actinomycetospora cinnamomea]|uniref:Membrane associated rhomboid family serine protease n=1 Tax=Actinomycetospora cinnamomea TaxID=663609 RepID=A0A2U1FF60_9PSEU|nr:rhomboid family intramembrane serine protease [Actinomycetospora cinnamomea]PVZ10814.1 membrane associated rhomboid family serine protease [Actinomycetospora cinnamomea]